MRVLSRLLLPAALVLIWCGTATADIAPGPGYVEDCTVAKKEQTGTTCEDCWSGRDAEGVCDEFYEGTDFEYVCQTSGATVWNEVWCDGPPRVGCSLAPGGGAATAVMTVTGMLGLLLVLRRRG